MKVDFIINETPKEETTKPRLGGLWRNADFLKLWTGQTISELGSRITRDGLPMTAVLVLGAAPAQMGFMTAVGAACTLIFGLIAGVWVDRMKRRPILIAADLARAAVLLSIPIAALAHRLTMTQLYATVALTGFCTVFFDVAYRSYLPALVGTENLLEGNSKLAMSGAIAEIAGPSLTGVLVQLITAPIAILFDAVSFLFSALSVGLIRKPEPEHEPTVTPPHPIEGLRFVFHHPILRPIAGFSITLFFFFGLIGPLYVLYALRELHLDAARLGFVIAVGGIGAMIGSTLAPVISRRLGIGRTLFWSTLGTAAGSALIPLAHGPLPMAVSFLVVQQLLGDMSLTVLFVNELTLRQSVTPPDVLGRVNAAMQLATRGVFPIGALVCGVVTGFVGVRATLAIAVSGIFLGSIWLLAPSLRRLRTIPK
ncbi:MAG TPA: MFS transporter, partial [Bryobacteraceae bacterium]|nr:MFS transporter [Bryobacteraceae bacterium]